MTEPAVALREGVTDPLTHQIDDSLLEQAPAHLPIPSNEAPKAEPQPQAAPTAHQSPQDPHPTEAPTPGLSHRPQVKPVKQSKATPRQEQPKTGPNLTAPAISPQQWQGLLAQRQRIVNEINGRELHSRQMAADAAMGRLEPGFAANQRVSAMVQKADLMAALQITDRNIARAHAVLASASEQQFFELFPQWADENVRKQDLQEMQDYARARLGVTLEQFKALSPVEALAVYDGVRGYKQDKRISPGKTVIKRNPMQDADAKLREYKAPESNDKQARMDSAFNESVLKVTQASARLQDEAKKFRKPNGQPLNAIERAEFLASGGASYTP